MIWIPSLGDYVETRPRGVLDFITWKCGDLAPVDMEIGDTSVLNYIPWRCKDRALRWLGFHHLVVSDRAARELGFRPHGALRIRPPSRGRDRNVNI